MRRLVRHKSHESKQNRTTAERTVLFRVFTAMAAPNPKSLPKARAPAKE